MQCSLKSSLVLFTCIFVGKSVVFSLSFEYSGYKLYRVIPENDTQLEFLLILRNSNSGLFFWNGIDTVGKEVDILVSPDVRSFFLEHLISHHIIVKEYFSDVKILMEQKEQPAIFPLTFNIEKESHPLIDSVPLQQTVSELNTAKNNSSEAVVEPELIPVKPVPGTRLSTGVFYTIGMLRYPKGFVTWAELSTGTGNYVQVDFKSSTQQYYSPGGKWFKDSQWIIVPTEDSNAFLLINRGAPEGIFTWTNETAPNGHFVQISTKEEHREFYAPGGKWRQDAMIFINATEIPDHYIIQIKNLPSGIITWTNKYGGANNKFLQVDTSPGSMTNYHPGQKWREDVLFKFSPVQKIKLSGIISDFRYEIDNSSSIIPTRRINILTMEKLKIPNNSGISQSFILKHNKTMTSEYSFKFNQTFTNFSNISCKANLPLKITEKDNSIQFTWKEGLELTSLEDMEKSVQNEYVIDTLVTILPHRTLEASWYCNWVDNLQVNFKAQIAITGFIEKMSIDRKIHSLPVSVLDVYYFLSRENIGELVGIRGNEVLVNVIGTFKGSYAIKDTFLTKNV